MKLRYIAGLAAAPLICAAVSIPAKADSPQTRKEVIHSCLLQIFESQQSKEAGDEYKALIALRPTDDALHYRYGLFLDKGGSAGAIAEFKKAADINPRNADYWGAMGMAQYRLRNYGGASASFGRAAGCGGKDVQKWQTLYQQMQQYIQQQREYNNYQKQLKDSQQ